MSKQIYININNNGELIQGYALDVDIVRCVKDKSNLRKLNRLKISKGSFDTMIAWETVEAFIVKNHLEYMM